MKDVSVGKALNRVDGRLKVTGKAQYAAEIPVANLTYAVIATSPVGRGRLLAVDTSRALKTPGVLQVITTENPPRLPGAKKKVDAIDRLLQLLQDDEIHYADQPVAVVVAASLESAQEAAASIHASYAETGVDIRLNPNSGAAYAPPKATRALTTRSSRSSRATAADARANANDARSRALT